MKNENTYCVYTCGNAYGIISGIALMVALCASLRQEKMSENTRH